jgi:hypothetical protein
MIIDELEKSSGAVRWREAGIPRTVVTPVPILFFTVHGCRKLITPLLVPRIEERAQPSTLVVPAL